MKQQPVVSPKIISSGWGRMEIEGLGKGKDFKLWPGGGRNWDWAENGTRHSSGIQRGDVMEIIENGARVVVLTRGVLSRLRVPGKTKRYGEERGVEIIVASTSKGIKIYNEYAEKGVAVGGLFHSTC